MTSNDLLAQLQEKQAESAALRELWNSLIPNTCPDEKQFIVWLGLHPLERMVLSVRRTAAKSAKLGGAMSPEHSVRFCSKVANTEKTKQESATERAA